AFLERVERREDGNLRDITDGNPNGQSFLPVIGMAIVRSNADQKVVVTEFFNLYFLQAGCMFLIAPRGHSEELSFEFACGIGLVLGADPPSHREAANEHCCQKPDNAL